MGPKTIKWENKNSAKLLTIRATIVNYYNDQLKMGKESEQTFFQGCYLYK